MTESGVKLTMEPSKGGASTTMEADVVLVATGRRPYTANLGCDELGISLDKMARIEVDSHFRTAVPSVFAIGDCIAGPMLAHKAEEEGIACVEGIAGFAGHVNYDAIPGVVYTYPEVAEVSEGLGGIFYFGSRVCCRSSPVTAVTAVENFGTDLFCTFASWAPGR